MKSKMILIDGIPGSGKSTTANFIHRQLQRSDIESHWFHELEKANPLFNAEYIQARIISDADDYVRDTLEKWRVLVRQIKESNTV
jgi:adenylate kinase family enzyme